MILKCKNQKAEPIDSEFTEEQRLDLNLPEPQEECNWVTDNIDLSKSLWISEVTATDENESDSCAESNGCTRIFFEHRAIITNVPYPLMEAWYSKKNTDIHAEYVEGSDTIMIFL